MSEAEIILIICFVGSLWFWGSIFIWPFRFAIMGLIFALFTIPAVLMLLPIAAYLIVCYWISIPFVDKKNPKHIQSMDKLRSWIRKTGKAICWCCEITLFWERKQNELDYANHCNDSDDLLEMHAMYEMSKKK